MLDFEAAFDAFIDRREYDQAQNALLSIIRISFKAGWLAAGGDPPLPQKVLEFTRCDRQPLPEGHPDHIETDI